VSFTYSLSHPIHLPDSSSNLLSSSLRHPSLVRQSAKQTRLLLPLTSLDLFLSFKSSAISIFLSYLLTFNLRRPTTITSITESSKMSWDTGAGGGGWNEGGGASLNEPAGSGWNGGGGGANAFNEPAGNDYGGGDSFGDGGNGFGGGEGGGRPGGGCFNCGEEG
jgi:hypothetical protein